ncbi:MAG TPA: MarR family transcriptional regulator [Candidatus Acidoferrales bacterium]|nr:MarR family transcriptional regulator [Candidatus Acidoferrales bacterium]
MKTRSPVKIDYKSLADFRYEIRRFLNFSEKAAHAAGIEPQQHQALLAIAGRPSEFETTVGALAERLQIRHHSAVELSHRLEANGWIHRSRSRDDARRVDLRITRRGEQLLQRLSVSHRNELETAGPRLIAALQSVLAQDRSSRSPHGSASRGAARRLAASGLRGSR